MVLVVKEKVRRLIRLRQELVTHLLAPCQNERGMALLVTFMVLALLVAVTLAYHKTAWHKYVVAFNLKTLTQLKSVAESAVHFGGAILQHDTTTGTSDSLLDPWATVRDEDLQDLFPFANAHLEIIDLSGLFQINSLVQRKDGKGKERLAGQSRAVEKESRAIFYRLLLSGGFAVENELQARQLIDALIDWLDGDDKESDYGAEHPYYRSLQPPYDCKNGAVEYIEELLLVKGMTPQLLFGSATTEALAPFLTVYGDDGRMNINTAPRRLIKSLQPFINDDLVESLDAYRKNPHHVDHLADRQWYKKIGGWPGDIVIYEDVLTTESVFFRIEGTGKSENLEKRVTAVVERVGRQKVKLLWRKVD